MTNDKTLFRQHIDASLREAERTLEPPQPEGIHIPRPPRPVIRRPAADTPALQWIEKMQADLASAQTPDKVFSIVRSNEVLAKSLLDATEAQTVHKYAQAFSDKLQELDVNYRAHWVRSSDDATVQQHRQQTLQKHINASDETAQRAYNLYVKQSMRLLIDKGHSTKDFMAAHDRADAFLQDAASVRDLKNATTASQVRGGIGAIRDAIRTVEGSQAKMLLREYIDNFERSMNAISPEFAALGKTRK